LSQLVPWLAAAAAATRFGCHFCCCCCCCCCCRYCCYSCCWSDGFKNVGRDQGIWRLLHDLPTLVGALQERRRGGEAGKGRGLGRGGGAGRSQYCGAWWPHEGAAAANMWAMWPATLLAMQARRHIKPRQHKAAAHQAKAEPTVSPSKLPMKPRKGPKLQEGGSQLEPRAAGGRLRCSWHWCEVVCRL